MKKEEREEHWHPREELTMIEREVGVIARRMSVAIGLIWGVITRRPSQTLATESDNLMQRSNIFRERSASRPSVSTSRKSALKALVVVLFSVPAFATFNANLTGTVTQILTFPDGTLYFTLSNQPTSNGPCNATYFELDPSAMANDAAFSRMYARLAMAYAAGESVSVGYDNTGGVCGGYKYMYVYRIG